jgi:hypothetical protein
MRGDLADALLDSRMSHQVELPYWEAEGDYARPVPVNLSIKSIAFSYFAVQAECASGVGSNCDACGDK